MFIVVIIIIRNYINENCQNMHIDRYRRQLVISDKKFLPQQSSKYYLISN